MKDLELAKEILERDQKTLVIVKGGEEIFSSDGKGIKPLYTALRDHKEDLRGSSAADKVVGRAAAMIYAYAGIKELSARLISDNALQELKNTSIAYEYQKAVPYIKNRDQSGMCPVETLSLKTSNIDQLLDEIRRFLENIHLL